MQRTPFVDPTERDETLIRKTDGYTVEYVVSPVQVGHHVEIVGANLYQGRQGQVVAVYDNETCAISITEGIIYSRFEDLYVLPADEAWVGALVAHRDYQNIFAHVISVTREPGTMRPLTYAVRVEFTGLKTWPADKTVPVPGQ